MMFDIVCLVLGLVLLFIGGEGLVRGSVSFAERFKLLTLLVSLVIVGFGTSTVVIRNVLGSNLFNILGILGVTSLITPIAFTGQIANFDVWIMLAVALIVFMLIFLNKQIRRMAGTFFLSAYTAYTIYLFMS